MKHTQAQQIHKHKKGPWQWQQLCSGWVAEFMYYQALRPSAYLDAYTRASSKQIMFSNRTYSNKQVKPHMARPFSHDILMCMTICIYDIAPTVYIYVWCKQDVLMYIHVIYMYNNINIYIYMINVIWRTSILRNTTAIDVCTNKQVRAGTKMGCFCSNALLCFVT